MKMLVPIMNVNKTSLAMYLAMYHEKSLDLASTI
jgi:hypothetical protein